LSGPAANQHRSVRPTTRMIIINTNNRN